MQKFSDLRASQNRGRVSSESQALPFRAKVEANPHVHRKELSTKRSGVFPAGTPEPTAFYATADVQHRAQQATRLLAEE